MSRARTSLKLVAASAELWSMGDTVRVIGASLGVSRAVVAAIASNRRDLFPRRKPGKQKGVGFWSRDKIVIAARLWAEGKSTAEVAEHFGATTTSANALITRNRELFPHRGDMLKQTGMRHPPKAKKPKAEPRAAKPKPAPTVPAAPKPAPAAAPVIEAAPVPKAATFHPLPGTSPASLMRVCGCRWPVECEDDRFVKAATYFCNEPRMMKADRYGRQKQSSYCATHDALSVGAGTISERQASGFLAQQGRFESRAS